VPPVAVRTHHTVHHTATYYHSIPLFSRWLPTPAAIPCYLTSGSGPCQDLPVLWTWGVRQVGTPGGPLPCTSGSVLLRHVRPPHPARCSGTTFGFAVLWLRGWNTGTSTTLLRCQTTTCFPVPVSRPCRHRPHSPLCLSLYCVPFVGAGGCVSLPCLRGRDVGQYPLPDATGLDAGSAKRFGSLIMALRRFGCTFNTPRVVLSCVPRGFGMARPLRVLPVFLPYIPASSLPFALSGAVVAPFVWRALLRTATTVPGYLLLRARPALRYLCCHLPFVACTTAGSVCLLFFRFAWPLPCSTALFLVRWLHASTTSCPHFLACLSRLYLPGRGTSPILWLHFRHFCVFLLYPARLSRCLRCVLGVWRFGSRERAAGDVTSTARFWTWLRAA